MMGVTLRGIAGRKIRSLLTALAIVLGIAMVSGTYVLTDTFQKAFNSIFTESYTGTDAVVSGKKLLEFSSSGRAPVPESVLAEIRALPEVDARPAGSSTSNNSNPAQLVDADGKKIGGKGGAPTFGVGLDSSELRFSPRAHDGRLGDGRGRGGHRREHREQRGLQRRRHDRRGRARACRAVRDHRNRDVRVGRLDRGRDIRRLRRADRSGPLPQGRALRLDLDRGQGRHDAEQLVEKLAPLVPATAEVQTGAAQASADAKTTNDDIGFITYFLLGFGGVALFVGAFVIFNTLSITVAQRTREFATLRTLGGSRRQVLVSVVIEGFVIGLLASIVGLFLGLGVGKGLNTLFVAMGIDLPQAGTVFATRTVVVSLIVGTTVTVLASIVPALRATRVPPISAVRGLDAARVPLRAVRAVRRAGHHRLRDRLARRRALRERSRDAGPPAAARGRDDRALPRCRTPGIPARQAARGDRGLAGAALRRHGGRARPGELDPQPEQDGLDGRRADDRARARHRRRGPRRALRNSTEGAVREQVSADYVVASQNGFDPFPAAVGDAVASTAGVELASTSATTRRWPTGRARRTSPVSIHGRSRPSTTSTGRRAPTQRSASSAPTGRS